MPVFQGPRTLPGYIFSMDAVPNVAAANNYLSLFNPVGSGRLMGIAAVFISSTLFTSSSIADSLRGYRITTATGGTLQADSAVTKLQNFIADPVAEVRTGNPSVTLGPAFFNSPSPIQDKSAPVHNILFPEAPPLSFGPGEGLVLRSSSGIGSGANWNISVAWAEI